MVESLLVFGALHTGRAPFGSLGWLGRAAAGNAIGGLVLVTLLRLARDSDRLQAERADATGSGSG